MNRQYEEVAENNGSDNTRWEPFKDPKHNPETSYMLEGYFKGQREVPGNDGHFLVTTVQIIENGVLGRDIDVAGGKVLNNKLEEIPMGSWIAIKYMGKVPVKSSPGKSYKDWKVFVDKNAVPYGQMPGATTLKAKPVVTAPVQQGTAPFDNKATNVNAPVFTPPGQNNVTPDPNANKQQGSAFKPGDLPF